MRPNVWFLSCFFLCISCNSAQCFSFRGAPINKACDNPKVETNITNMFDTKNKEKRGKMLRLFDKQQKSINHCWVFPVIAGRTITRFDIRHEDQDIFIPPIYGGNINQNCNDFLFRISAINIVDGKPVTGKTLEWCNELPQEVLLLHGDSFQVEMMSNSMVNNENFYGKYAYGINFERLSTCDVMLPGIRNFAAVSLHKMGFGTDELSCVVRARELSYDDDDDEDDRHALELVEQYTNTSGGSYMDLFSLKQHHNGSKDRYIATWPDLSPHHHCQLQRHRRKHVESSSGFWINFVMGPGTTDFGYFVLKAKGYCFPGRQPCQDGENCFLDEQRCDGVANCPNLTDELDCPKVCSSEEFNCMATSMGKQPICIPQFRVCDGVADCVNRRDEKFCLFCNETTARACETKYESRFFLCYAADRHCNNERDCFDESDERDCPPTRKVITASSIGGLVCGVLFACALGCSLKLFGLRNANARRHHLALQQTPIGRMTRRLLQREAPPSYNMAVHGREHEESSSSSSRRHRRNRDNNNATSSSSSSTANNSNNANGEASTNNNSTSSSSSCSSRRHRRRHRRRRSEIRIRRSQPSAADLAVFQRQRVAESWSSSSTRRCRSNNCEHLLCNESAPDTTPPAPVSRSSRGDEAASAGGESVDETTLVVVPNRPTSSIFSFSHGASIVNFPLARICTHVPAATLPQASIVPPPTPSPTNRGGCSRDGGECSVSRLAGGDVGKQTAMPLPKKRPIMPVLVAAPCDDVGVDQTPACLYPNPPTYHEALRDITIPLDDSLVVAATNQSSLMSASRDQVLRRHQLLGTDSVPVTDQLVDIGTDQDTSSSTA